MVVCEQVRGSRKLFRMWQASKGTTSTDHPNSSRDLSSSHLKHSPAIEWILPESESPGADPLGVVPPDTNCSRLGGFFATHRYRSQHVLGHLKNTMMKHLDTPSKVLGRLLHPLLFHKPSATLNMLRARTLYRTCSFPNNASEPCSLLLLLSSPDSVHWPRSKVSSLWLCHASLLSVLT